MPRKSEPETARRIEYLRLSDIVAADVNPKQHDTAGIATSISRWGFADAPILDERTSKLVAGHGRLADLRAREESGESPPEGIMVDGEGAWLAPVQRGWASRSDAEASAFLIGHNRLGENGGWDNGPLLELLTELKAADVDLFEATGFDDLALGVMGDPTDPDEEWEGMPEFEQDDMRGVAHVAIHFATQEDADAFFTLIDRPRKASMWWPQGDGHLGKDRNKQYVAEAL